jgi:hypothetical protein
MFSFRSIIKLVWPGAGNGTFGEMFDRRRVLLAAGAMRRGLLIDLRRRAGWSTASIRDYFEPTTARHCP